MSISEEMKELNELINAGKGIKFSSIEKLLDSKWHFALLDKMNENNINLNKIKKGHFEGKEVFVAHYGTTGESDIVLSLEQIVRFIIDNKDLMGIIIDVEENSVFIEKWVVFYLYINKLIILDIDTNEELAEKKSRELLMKLVRNKDEYGIWNLLYIMSEIFKNNSDRYYFYMANFMEKRNELNNAEILYKKALNCNPDNYWLYYKLGKFYEKNEFNKLALEVYKTAYKKYRLNREQRTECEGTICFIIKELINNPKTSFCSRNEYIDFWKKEKLIYSGNNNKYMYDELEEEENGIY